MCSKTVEDIYSHDHHPHPLFKSLGPISITLGILLRSIGPAHPLVIQNCLNSIDQHLNPKLNKPMILSVLGILIGPVYLKHAPLELLMVCLKVWIKVLGSELRNRSMMGGKSGLEGLVWKGICEGICGLDDQEVRNLVRWLEPWGRGKDVNHDRFLVYLLVLEIVIGRIDGSYLDENILEKVWEEVEKIRNREDSRTESNNDDDHHRLKFQSAWKVLISIIKYRKLKEEDGEEIHRFVDRMMDLVLSSNQLNKDETESLESQVLKKESLKVMIENFSESVIWDHVIHRLEIQNDYQKLIEVLNYLENPMEFIKLCKVLKGLIDGIEDEIERDSVIEQWFLVVSLGRFVEGVGWWIDQFGTQIRTGNGNGNGNGIRKGLAKL